VEEILAYAAGLIDGEGTITLSRDHVAKNRIPVISMTSTTPELILWIQKEFGGQVRHHRTYKPHHRDSMIWSAKYDCAIEMIRGVRPYLKEPEKVRRADLILDRYKPVTRRNGKYTELELAAKQQFESEFFHPSTP